LLIFSSVAINSSSLFPIILQGLSDIPIKIFPPVSLPRTRSGISGGTYAYLFDERLVLPQKRHPLVVKGRVLCLL